MEKAILKAIEGGYDRESAKFEIIPNEGKDSVKAFLATKYARSVWLYPRIWADPLFWQALGKAEGWPCWACEGKGWHGDFFDKRKRDKDCGNCHGTGLCEVKWKQEWHRFIDHLAEGKSPDDFFTNLLK